ncbi:MAG TPA: PAS domain-containing protein [Myxococcota bacterium]|nr:PAS domain-containing protein [Myxococcota bacterium]
MSEHWLSRIGRAVVGQRVADPNATREDDAALKDENERFHLALNLAGAGALSWDVVRDEFQFDPQILDGLGRSGDLAPRRYADVLAFVHPDDREALDAAVQRCLEDDVPLDQHFRGLHVDGAVLHLAVRGRVTRDAEGRPLRLLGLGLDHTNAFRSAEALRAREERLRRITAQIPGVVYQYREEPDGTYSFPYVSEGVLELYGVTPETVYADPESMFRGIRAEDLPPLLASIRRSRETLQQWREDYIFDRHDGRTVWLSACSTPVREPDGSTLWHGWIVDASERKRTEQALQESEGKLRHIATQIPGAVYQFRLAPDGSYSFPYISDGVFGLYGVTAEEAYADPGSIFQRIDPEDAAAHGESIRRSAETLSHWHMEFRVVRTDGARRWLSARAAPTREHDGSILWHGWVIDVTDAKRAEEERRSFEAKLQHAQKLESLGILAGGIAHDFNNLLTGILGHADLALEELPEDSSVRENLLQMVTAARRAADLSKQMLAYSGKGRFTLKRIRLPELVTEMSHLLEVSISKRCALRRELDPDMPAIEADPTQLRQVIMNLILNASDAIGEESGVIVVRTGVQRCDRAYLSRCYLDDDLPPGRYAFLEVEDTGEGMSPETVARIFEPFFTTKFAGRGLGLAAVLGIVRGHRGAIRITSEPGRGTIFRVLLPASEAPAEPLDVPTTERKAYRGGGLVLVVDDEEAVRRLARTMLERLGFEVIVAAGGREAVALFREHRDRVRVVLLDMTMHPMGGAETYRALREVRADVRVVLSSGYSEQEAARELPGSGVAGFLQKPYRVEDLVASLRRALGEE